MKDELNKPLFCAYLLSLAASTAVGVLLHTFGGLTIGLCVLLALLSLLAFGAVSFLLSRWANKPPKPPVVYRHSTVFPFIDVREAFDGNPR